MIEYHVHKLYLLLYMLIKTNSDYECDLKITKKIKKIPERRISN